MINRLCWLPSFTSGGDRLFKSVVVKIKRGSTGSMKTAVTGIGLVGERCRTVVDSDWTSGRSVSC